MRIRTALATLPLALLALAGAVPAHAAAAGQRWSVLMMGNPAGSLTAERQGDTLRTHYEYNDRGRGPSIDSTYRLAADGTPRAVTNDGNEYLKAKVHEEFVREGDHARWKNRGEDGHAEVKGAAFFVSFEGSPLEMGLLAAAASHAPGQTLALLPIGKATARRVGELEVSGTPGKRRVVEWELDGLGFSPTPVWLDDKGAFFASVDEWMTVVPAGFEQAVPAMLAMQHTASDARLATLARTLPQHAEHGLAFTGAALFDAESGTVRPGMTLLVQGDRIAAVGADGTVAIPAGARVVDARGKTLIPGLWDMHVHVGDLDGLLDMAAGVTTVRDLGNDTDSLLARRKQWDTGAAIGPRVLLGGLIDGPGPYAGPTKVLVDTPEKATAAVDRFADLGYQQIKIYSSVDPKLVPVIAQRAHARGLRVSGHVPAHMIAEQAIAEGYDEIQHVNFLFLDLWPQITETRTPARFTEVAERAADVDLAAAPAQQLIGLMRARDTVSDPTVNVFEGMFTSRPGALPTAWATQADRLPPVVRRGLLAGGLPVPAGKDERYRASFRKLLDMVAALHKVGVRIVAGTDDLGGFALHRELELYVQAGIPAPEVLRIATLGAAQVMHRDADLGSLTPGKLADLDVVDGDPTRDISAVRRISTVVKGGVLYDAAALYAALGVAPPR